MIGLHIRHKRCVKGAPVYSYELLFEARDTQFTMDVVLDIMFRRSVACSRVQCACFVLDRLLMIFGNGSELAPSG